MYAVIENFPGCLPEVEPSEFDTKREAQDFAGDLAMEYRDQGYKVIGTKTDGYYFVPEFNRVIEVAKIL